MERPLTGKRPFEKAGFSFQRLTLRGVGLGTVLAGGLLAAAVSAIPPDIVQPWTNTKPKPRGAELFRTAMLDGHNEARAAVGAPPMRWNETLAREAEAYAAQLARTRRFEHSVVPDQGEVQGENLWMGTRTAFSYQEMVGGWTEEQRQYKKGRFPEVSRSGDWTDVGHYTQMIWRSTRQVGCGTASNARDDYLVCRYLEAGNVDGEDPLTTTVIG